MLGEAVSTAISALLLLCAPMHSCSRIEGKSEFSQQVQPTLDTVLDPRNCKSRILVGTDTQLIVCCRCLHQVPRASISLSATPPAQLSTFGSAAAARRQSVSPPHPDRYLPRGCGT